MNLKQFLILAITGVVIGILASGAEKWWRQNQMPNEGQQLVQLPTFTLSDLEGKRWHSAEHADKVLVVNFWATWCPPCLKEMPVFSKLQAAYASQGVEFVGIAIDDQDSVQNFVDTYGIEFTILLGDTAAIELSERLGNRFSALPFTLLVDKGGNIKFRHAGAIQEQQLRPLLDKLLDKQLK